MQLEAVTAELRPRSDWEAVDLGIALARRDFRRVFACWWLAMLPVAVIGGIFLHDELVWWMLLIWWWTPVASRLVLFYLSRHLFGERPGWKALLRELPRAMVRRFFFRMILARLSPWRPLSMAVEDLEGLRGKLYGQRVKLLLRRGDSSLVVLALWRLVLLFLLTAALFKTTLMFMPEAQADRWNEVFQEWGAGGWLEPPPMVRYGLVATLTLSMSLTDIFATGIGFGVYVNHRTWIEGWDVEISLRRLANRLRGLTAVLVLAGVFFFASSPTLSAATRSSSSRVKPHAKPLVEPEEDPTGVKLKEDPAEVIKTIKQDKDFEVHKIQVPNPSSASHSSGPSSPGTGPNLAALSVLGPIFGWSLAALALTGLIFALYYYFRNFKSLGLSGGRVPKIAPSARVVMGMDVAPESLPKDIPAQALELWRAGHHHEAMSLLYRGAISRLIETERVEIAESDTESDCLRRVSVTAPSRHSYFGGLTQVWLRLAYARLLPQNAEIETLCSTWPFASMERRAR